MKTCDDAQVVLRRLRAGGTSLLLAALGACSPSATSVCSPAPAASPVGSIIVTAGAVQPLQLRLRARLCGIAEDALSAFAVARGPGVSVSPAISQLRFDEKLGEVVVTVDLTAVPPGAYLLQVIVDPAVASTTVSVLVAEDRRQEPVERRALAAPCEAPRLTTTGTVFCREPAGQERGWRVERPGRSVTPWPLALDVKNAGDVVWVLEGAGDAGVTVRRQVDVNGGLLETHTGGLGRNLTAFHGVSEARAFFQRWHVHAAPGFERLTVGGYSFQGPVGQLAADDLEPVSFSAAEVCRILGTACYRAPFREFVADDGAHGWFTTPHSTVFGTTPFVELTATTRPMGADAGIVVKVPLSATFLRPRPDGDVFGGLVFSDDAGVFRGHVVEGAFALERLPTTQPVDVTRDWVVSQPSPRELELFRLRP